MGLLPNCSKIVLIVGLKGTGFDWQIISLPPLLVLELCHDKTAWWDSKSWNSEKPGTASPRSLRVKRMNPRSSLLDWPNPGQKCVADSGKANCRQENMKRYSCLPLHQHCYACVKESMQLQTFQFSFGC